MAKRKASAVLLRRCIGKATSQAWSGTDDKPLPTQRKRELSVLGRRHAFEGDFIIPHHFSCPSPGHVQHRHRQVPNATSLQEKESTARETKLEVKLCPRIFMLLFLFLIPSLAHTTRRSNSLYVPTPDSPLRLAPSHHRLHETTTTILSCFSTTVVRSPLFNPLFTLAPRCPLLLRRHALCVCVHPPIYSFSCYPFFLLHGMHTCLLCYYW